MPGCPCSCPGQVRERWSPDSVQRSRPAGEAEVGAGAAGQDTRGGGPLRERAELSVLGSWSLAEGRAACAQWGTMGSSGV